MEQFDVLVPLWLTKVTYKQVVYGACFRTAVCLCVWCVGGWVRSHARWITNVL